jgi:hypothetical protein
MSLVPQKHELQIRQEWSAEQGQTQTLLLARVRMQVRGPRFYHTTTAAHAFTSGIPDPAAHGEKLTTNHAAVPAKAVPKTM